MAAAAQAVNSQFVGPIWKYAHNDTCLARYPFPESKNYGWWFCITNKDAPPQIILMGSSFANHLYPGLISEANIGNKVILSIGACGFDEPMSTDDSAPTTYSPCSGDRPYRQKEFFDRIVATENIKYAIIDGLSQYQLPDEIERISERVTYLEKWGITAIIFVPHVTTDGALKACFARPLKEPTKDCTFDISRKKEIDAHFQPLIDAMAKSHPRVKFFNQNDFMCNDKKCSFVVDGMPVFRDEYSHYSEFASDRVADLFAKWAKQNEPGILLPVDGKPQI
jgi:hypothetical protein